MGTKVTDLPGATVIADDDTLMIVQDSSGLSKQISASVITSAGGGGGGDTNVIWQWDGTLNDFTSGNVPEVGTGNSGSLDLVTSWRGLPALRMSGSGAAMASWVVNPASLSGTLPSRFTVEYEFEEMSDSAQSQAVDSRFGPSLFCRYIGSGSVIAYGACGYGHIEFMNQTWTSGSGMSASGTTPVWRKPGTGNSRGLIASLDVEMTLGAAFDMSVKGSLIGSTGTLFYVRYIDSTGLDFNGTSFNNQTPNTIGLTMNATTLGDYADLTRFRVLRHPADRV